VRRVVFAPNRGQIKTWGDDERVTTHEEGEPCTNARHGIFLNRRGRVCGMDGWTVVVVYFLRLCCMWACTNVLAAKAANRLSSPARVADATTVANLRALAPGSVE